MRDEVDSKLRPGPFDENEDVRGDVDGSDGPSGEDPRERNELDGLFETLMLSNERDELPAATIWGSNNGRIPGIMNKEIVH